MLQKMLRKQISICLLIGVTLLGEITPSYCQRLAEQGPEKLLPTAIPSTPTPPGPLCRTISVKSVPYACMHVRHGGSKSAAHAMNRKIRPEYEASCEIQVPLQGYYSDDESLSEEGMQITFSPYGLYGGGEGKNYPNDFKQTAGPSDFSSFNQSHPANTTSRVSYVIQPGRQDLGTTSGRKIMWWRAELDPSAKTLALKAVLNGWGKCRWQDPHCYAFINQLDIEFKVCR